MKEIYSVEDIDSDEDMDFDKRRQSVNLLTDICRVDGNSALSIKIDAVGGYPGIGSIREVTTSKLGGLRPEDFLIFTHNYSNGNNAEFVTNKITIADLEYLLYEFRLKALSTDMLNMLDLKDLAYKTETQLDLQKMSHKQYVVSSDLYRYGARTDSSISALSSLPLDVIDCNWDDFFKEKTPVIRTELGLGNLAYRHNIDYDSLSFSLLVNPNKRWPIDKIISNFGYLALSSYEDLNLSALSHRNSIDLAIDYDKYVTGKLNFNNVSDYEDKIHDLVIEFLPLATTEKFGAVKLKRDEYLPNTRNYAVKMEDGLSTLYTTVPWVDTNTLSTFTLRSGGINTLILEGYGVNRSLDVTNNRYNDISSPAPIFTQEITLLPHIERNIVLSPDLVVHENQDHDCCLARFSPKRNHLELEDGPSFIDDKSYESQYLSHNGTWVELPLASETLSGLMTKEDYVCLDNIKKLHGNFYDLSVASPDVLGGIKTGYMTDASHGVYAVQLNKNNQAFVNIPNPITQYKNDVVKTADNLIREMLYNLYPVGAIYITVNTSCPLVDLMPGSEWTQVSGGRCLWGYDGLVSLGKNINAGLPALPEHTHTVTFGFSSTSGSGGFPYHGGTKQCPHSSNKFPTSSVSYSSDIYGKSKTVQPPAYVVNIFLRTK